MAPFHKGSPGCPCCEDCTIFADDFERSGGSDLGSSWDERSGDWSIASGAAVCNSANGLMVTTLSNPGGTAEAHISAVVRLSTANDVARLILGYVDDSNYYFANLRITSTQAHVKIVRRQSGSNTDLGFEISVSGGINTNYRLSFCRTGGVYVASITKADEVFIEQYTQANVSTSTGLGAGIGTGTRTGTIEFREVEWSYLRSESRPTCPMCGQPCVNCEEGTWPHGVQLEFSGVASAANCGDCEDVNDTVYLAKPFLPVPSGLSLAGGNAECVYQVPVACDLWAQVWPVGAPILFFNQRDVRVHQPASSANPGLLDGEFNSGPAGSDTSHAIDCGEVRVVTNTFDRHTTNPTQAYCQWGSASCTATPLV